MLDRIFGADDAEAESHVKNLEARVKLKIKTGADYDAIKALYFKRPRLFHKGRATISTERNKSRLNRLTDAKVWKSGGEGVRQHIIQEMNVLLITMTHDINFTFGTDPKLAKAQILAITALNATVNFVTQLLQFVDIIYEKLHDFSKFTAEQAWALTTQILDRICEDLYAPN